MIGLDDTFRRLETVKTRMAEASLRAGRETSEVTLLPVTKTRSVAEIQRLYEVGVRSFGENRVAELKEKIPRLGSDCSWHMIGHLQSNKARECLNIFMIHSLESLSAARALEKVFSQVGRKIRVLIEVNSGEEQKHGLETLDDVRRLREQIHECPHLVCEGLMTMAPFVRDEKILRGAFSRLYQWRESLVAEAPGHAMPVLSMGMSNDFEWAIQEGSTLVRIGTALFEDRP